MRTNTSGAGFIRSGLLIAYSEAARELGLDPYRMIRKAYLPVAALENPELRIPVDRLQDLIEESAKAADCEEFGLLVGSKFKLSMKGPLGLLVRHLATVREAIEAMKRYRVHFSLYTEAVGGDLRIAPVLSGFRQRRSRQMVEMATAMYVQILRGLLGEAWKPVEVAFAHAAPRGLSPYQAAFGSVAFDALTPGFLVTQTDLDTPIPDADAALAGEIARFMDRSAQPDASATMTETVSDLIQRLLPGGHCTADLVAQHLGVNRRTVHRKLLAEDTTFKDLVDEIRRAQVTDQLKHGDATLTAVTSQLGFSSLSTFSRWFRQTYGIQPSEFRRLSHEA